MEPQFLALDEVLEIHQQQIEIYGGSPGVRDPAALESAVFRVLAVADDAGLAADPHAPGRLSGEERKRLAGHGVGKEDSAVVLVTRRGRTYQFAGLFPGAGLLAASKARRKRSGTSSSASAGSPLGAFVQAIRGVIAGAYGSIPVSQRFLLLECPQRHPKSIPCGGEYFWGACVDSARPRMSRVC